MRGLLVLGSGSPRRHEILESLGVSHVVFTAGVDEQVLAGEAPDDYLVRVVGAKRGAVERALPDDLRARAAAVLVADTVVVLSVPGQAPRILGKPADEADAARTVGLLGGTTHEVKTRFALATPGGAEHDSVLLHEETVTTRVTFRALTDARARAYAATGEGRDKAGAYAIQGKGGALVARIEGSYTNVVGLPACELSVALERFGLA